MPHRLLDTVRRIVTPDVETQDRFLDALLSLDEFEGNRVKSTMPDENAQVKQTIFNVEFTPKTTGFRPRPLVYGDIANDPKIEAHAREFVKDKLNCKLGVTMSDVNAALKLFEAPAVAKKPVSMTHRSPALHRPLPGGPQDLPHLVRVRVKAPRPNLRTASFKHTRADM